MTMVTSSITVGSLVSSGCGSPNAVHASQHGPFDLNQSSSPELLFFVGGCGDFQDCDGGSEDRFDEHFDGGALWPS